MIKHKGKTAKRILLVEDEPLLATMYMLALQQRVNKAEVYGAKTREEARRIIDRVRPDLILLDLLIPSGKVKGLAQDYHHPVGLQFLSTLRKDPKTKLMKVIILSNLDADEQRKRAIALGAEDFLVKASLKPHAVVDRVKRALKIR